MGNGYVVHALLRRLFSAGIRIQPYYVFVENAADSAETSDEPITPEGYEEVLLGDRDMEEVSRIIDARKTPVELRQRLADQQLCIALKDGDRIVSLSWCNLRHFHSRGLKFSLRSNEAYLYGTETVPEYRGRGLAPAVRRACSRTLAKRGRSVIYSYSLMLNKPAVRVQEKVGAQVWLKCVYLEIGSGFARNWILKSTRAASRPIQLLDTAADWSSDSPQLSQTGTN